MSPSDEQDPPARPPAGGRHLRLAEPVAPEPGSRRLGLTISAITALVCIGGALAIPPLREAVVNALQGDTDAVRDELRELGTGGYLILFGLTLVHTFVWYPTEIINTAAGFVYGFWPALVVCLTGWTLSGVLGWMIGRSAGRPLLYRVIGEQRFRRAETLVDRGGVTLLLAMRLVPIVPFSLFSFAAGAARVPLGRFTWTSAVGYLPITALFVFFGSRIEEVSLTDPLLWLGLAALLAMLLAIRFLKPRHEEPAGEGEDAETARDAA